MDSDWQKDEARRFVAQRRDEVGALECAIANAALAFLDGPGKPVLDEKEAQAAKRAIGCGDVFGFGSILRHYGRFVAASGGSRGCWALVDAVNFLGDAIGWQWRYMTAAGREQSLLWASECVEELESFGRIFKEEV